MPGYDMDVVAQVHGESVSPTGHLAYLSPQSHLFCSYLFFSSVHQVFTGRVRLCHNSLKRIGLEFRRRECLPTAQYSQYGFLALLQRDRKCRSGNWGGRQSEAMMRSEGSRKRRGLVAWVTGAACCGQHCCFFSASLQPQSSSFLLLISTWKCVR